MPNYRTIRRGQIWNYIYNDFDEDGFHFLTNFIPKDDLQIYEAAIAKFATISPHKQLIIKKAIIKKAFHG
jgi:hypothetical protein